MHKQKRTAFLAVAEQLLPVFLAVVCIVVMCVNTQQSVMATPLRLNFEGEYSFDGGTSWEVLTVDSDLSTERGDLMLRGHFDYDMPENAVLYIYRDHFGITSKVNEQTFYMTIQAQILTMGEAGEKYHADTCGREWQMLMFAKGLAQTDTIEFHLQKMHDHIEADAYRNFLNSCYMGPTDSVILEEYLQPQVTPWIVLGILFLIAAIMMLGAAAAAAVLQTSVMRELSKLGFLLLFAGGYLILDTVTLSFWSETQVFNTYARQICMMLAVYWMELGIRDGMTGMRRTIAKVVLGASLVLNVVLIVPSFLGMWAIYDTAFVWAAAQVVFAVVLLGVSVGELLKGSGKKYLNRGTCIVLPVTLLLDIASVGSSMYSHGTCTKCAFAALFVVHGFCALKRILIDYQGARRAKKLEKELEESRITSLLSQMQPHFVHNILNVIYYMCGKDPAAAQAAISKFSDHLRNNLEAVSQKELITFRKEMDHIRTYLELEQIRFGDELLVVYDIEEDSFLLPVLSVQPLVENAVKHGIAKKRGGGTVTIASRQVENAYQITVTDTGAGFEVDRYMEDGKVHVGLVNVRQRLCSRMKATLDIVSEPGEGTTVTITIPKEKGME